MENKFRLGARRIILFLFIFFVFFPLVASSAVLTEAQMDFNWLTTGGLTSAASGSVQFRHNYLYTDVSADTETFNAWYGSVSVPGTREMNTSSTEGPNYANSKVVVDTANEGTGNQGALAFSAYADLNPSGQYSTAGNGYGIWNLDVSFSAGSEGFENQPDWTLNIDLDTWFNSAMDGSHTSQESISQFTLRAYYYLYGETTAVRVYDTISLLNLVEWVYETTDVPLESQNSWTLYLNPYDSLFSFDVDIESLEFTPLRGKVGLDLEMGTTSRIYEENPQDAPAPVPEPSTVLLLGSGVIVLVCYGRKRNPSTGRES